MVINWQSQAAVTLCCAWLMAPYLNLFIYYADYYYCYCYCYVFRVFCELDSFHHFSFVGTAACLNLTPIALFTLFPTNSCFHAFFFSWRRKDHNETRPFRIVTTYKLIKRFGNAMNRCHFVSITNSTVELRRVSFVKIRDFSL